MNKIKFVVHGHPHGKARPRVLSSGRAYTPRKTREYEQRVREAFIRTGKKGFPAGVPLVALIIADFAIPKSVRGQKRREILDGKVWSTKRPDADNIAKSILDALNGFAYHDDSQVVLLAVKKQYRDAPAVTVEIFPADQG